MIFILILCREIFFNVYLIFYDRGNQKEVESIAVNLI